jgi:hypothetical protein
MDQDGASPVVVCVPVRVVSFVRAEVQVAMLRFKQLISTRARRTLILQAVTSSLLLAACSSKEGSSNSANAGASGVATAGSGASLSGAAGTVGVGGADAAVPVPSARSRARVARTQWEAVARLAAARATV